MHFSLALHFIHLCHKVLQLLDHLLHVVIQLLLFLLFIYYSLFLVLAIVIHKRLIGIIELLISNYHEPDTYTSYRREIRQELLN